MHKMQLAVGYKTISYAERGGEVFSLGSKFWGFGAAKGRGVVVPFEGFEVFLLIYVRKR
jgi:hypothetical protein